MTTVRKGPLTSFFILSQCADFMGHNLFLQSRNDEDITQVLPVLDEDDGGNPEYSSREKRDLRSDNVIRASDAKVNGKDLRIVYMVSALCQPIQPRNVPVSQGMFFW